MKSIGGCLGICVLLAAGNVKAQPKTAREVVGKYHNVFTTPPTRTPSMVAVDAPLLGNGSIAAAIAGLPEQQNYYLARNDFWRLKSGFNESYPAVLGKLSINIPAIKNGAYKIEQDLFTATALSVFSKGDTSVRIQSMVTATKDWLLIDITNTGKVPVKGQALLELPGSDQFHINPPKENKFPDTTAHGSNSHGVQWIQRGFVKEVDIPVMAAVACKVRGNSSNEFLIAPGQTISIACVLTSNFKTANALQAAQQQANHLTTAIVKKEKEAHKEWWGRYWNESFVDIGDSVIEHQYYRSQYNMAACSRDPRFPPGIFGSWVTKEVPAWNGDYHLNYNYSAPFYALYSSNHLQQALPYEAPVLDFMQRGKYYSGKITGIHEGVLYPVGIGPLGIETTRKNALMSRYMNGYIKEGQVEDEGLFFGQKSNAAYCATDLSMKFYHTYDPAFTQRVYPFIKSVAVFWQHYLKKENDHYSIENDAIHEGTIGTKNPILSLGLVPMVFRTAIDMSKLLGVDKLLRNMWQGKMDSLAGYTTQVMNGKTVFRYSEKGTGWWSGNTLGIQHIYPSGAIGLSSRLQQLEIAKNTISEMSRWMDHNGSNSFFPAAVRVGYDADTILKYLRFYSLHTYPNGFQLGNPHGIENCSTVPNTINEMLCMSNDGLLRVFEVWPKTKDASFQNIRGEGAFLVSSRLENTEIKYIKIISERGRTCILQNPWRGKTVLVRSNMRAVVWKTGELIQLPTLKGEVLTLTTTFTTNQENR